MELMDGDIRQKMDGDVRWRCWMREVTYGRESIP